MGELAPGLYVSDFIPPDKAFVIDRAALFGNEAGRGLAVSTETWERLPGAERERILDDLTRQDAERGLRRLEDWMATNRMATNP